MAQTITVKIAGEASGFKKAADEVEQKSSGLSGTFKKLAGVAVAAFAGKEIIDFAHEAVDAAEADQQAEAKLNQAISNNTHATKEQKKAADEWIDSQARATGVAKDQLYPQLTKLVGATGNVSDSQNILTTAMNISAGTGKDLGTVVDALIRAHNGQVGGLSRLGLATKDATGHTLTFGQVMATANQRYGKDAQAAANTTAGRVARLKVAYQDFQESIGRLLLPVLTKLSQIGLKVMDFMQKHRPVAIALAAVVGGVLTVAFFSWAASLFAVDGALAILASPIALIVIGIAAMAAGIVYLWTHWNEVWNLIMHHKAYAIIAAILLPIPALIFEIVAVAHFLYENWDAIWAGVQHVVQVAWGVIAPVFNGIRSTAEAFVSFVSDLFHGRWAAAFTDLWHIATGWIDTIIAVFGGIPSRIGSALGDLGSIISKPFTAAWDGLKRAWNDSVGNIHVHFRIPPFGPSFDFDGPRLAMGGIVTRPTLALVGEAGPEAVIPLNRTHTAIGSGNRYMINVSVPPTANTAQIGAEIVNAIKQYERRSGIGWRG